MADILLWFLSGKALSKIKIHIGLILWILLFSPVLNGEAICADKPKKQDTIEIDNIFVNKITKEIKLNVRLALTEGILEYLLVSDPGKTYESVFKIAENVPSKLNFAMLLLGFKPLNFDRLMKLTHEKDGLSKLLKGHKESLVELYINKNGKRVTWDRFMKRRQAFDSPFIWVYTGGWFTEDNRYVGDWELSHIAIWPDPTCVISLFSDMGNPYRGGFGLEMNRENKFLEVDQDFEIIIRRYSK